LLRLQPDNANAYANLGVLALSRSDYKAAAEFFQNATRLEPQLWSARALLGLCKIRTGERAAGEKLIDESLPHVDAAVVRKQTGLALVDSYAASGQLAKAINTIESLKRGHPADADILYTAYRTYSELAAHALSALAHAAPDSVRMHEVMAQNLMSQENASGAIAEYRKALALDSRVPGLHFELGQAIRSASNTAAARKEAEQEFRAELEINPSDANALYEIGELVFEGGGFDDAASHFRRAIDLRPAFAEARIALGKALAAEGKPAEALEQYREVIRLEPDNDVVHYRLAQAYKKLGRDAEARQELAHYSELKAIRERIGVIVSQAERRAVREQNIDSPQ
jgi:tetratricopeptide (TPR) repeat protein